MLILINFEEDYPTTHFYHEVSYCPILLIRIYARKVYSMLSYALILIFRNVAKPSPPGVLILSAFLRMLARNMYFQSTLPNVCKVAMLV